MAKSIQQWKVVCFEELFRLEYINTVSPESIGNFDASCKHYDIILTVFAAFILVESGM